VNETATTTTTRTSPRQCFEGGENAPWHRTRCQFATAGLHSAWWIVIVELKGSSEEVERENHTERAQTKEERGCLLVIWTYCCVYVCFSEYGCVDVWLSFLLFFFFL
jgi:hypothetical protein